MPSYPANKRTLETRLNTWNWTRHSDGKDFFQYRKHGHWGVNVFELYFGIFIGGLPGRQVSTASFLSNVSRWPKKHFFEGVQSLPVCLSDKSTLKWKCVGVLVEWCWQGKARVLEEKHLPLQHYPKQILVGFTWIWTLDFAVRGRLISPSLLLPFPAVDRQWKI